MKPLALAILMALSSPAFAQDQDQEKKDPFKDFKYGQRVEIMLRSGFGVLGKIMPFTIRRDEKLEVVDLADTKTILLDMSLEYPELGGTKDPISGKFLPMIIGFERAQVKSVRDLGVLTQDEVAAREKAREEALTRILADEASRRKTEAEADEQRERELAAAAAKEKAAEGKTPEGEHKLKEERLAKARAIYAKFPPSAGWGPDKMKEIAAKAVRHQPLTSDEQEFLENQEDWYWYRNEIEKSGGKAETPKTEAPKAETPPK